MDDVQRGQLRRLLDVMNRPNISVQVLPLQAGGMAGMPGSFVMVSSGRQRSAVLS
jgi:hypothetical protein